eukprot:2768-Heterococcus_DN1.PRE.2
MQYSIRASKYTDMTATYRATTGRTGVTVLREPHLMYHTAIALVLCLKCEAKLAKPEVHGVCCCEVLQLAPHRSSKHETGLLA